MIIARKIWIDGMAGPAGGIKSVSIELRDDATGWHHTEAVAIAPGDDASEQAQLDRAVPKMMEKWDQTGQWCWD